MELQILKYEGRSGKYVDSLCTNQHYFIDKTSPNPSQGGEYTIYKF